MVHRFIILTIIVLLLFCSMPLSVFAELDWVDLALQDQYPVQLRWDNVEGAPLWVGGEKPLYAHTYGYHTVVLPSREMTAVLIPPGERLRLVGCENPLEKDDVSVLLSNGSGLLYDASVVESCSDRSLIVSPGSTATLLARIRNRNETTHDLEVAVFVSRHEAVEKTAPYRRAIVLDAPKIDISRSDAGGKESFSMLEAGTPVTVNVTGPNRFVFESRLVYSENDSNRARPYQVFVMDQERIMDLFDQCTLPESHAIMKIDGKATVLGRLEKGYWSVPEGCHTVTLVATATVCARILLQDDPDYLFPEINGPQPNARAVSETIPPPIPFWKMDEQQLKACMENTRTSPAQMEQCALRLAQDNSHRDGGLVAAMLMRETALFYPGVSTIQATALQVLQNYTFFRDLVPCQVPKKTKHYGSKFLASSIRNPYRDSANRFVSEQHHKELWNGIPRGYFFSVPSEQGAFLIYELPERFCPTILRVVVDSASDTGEEILIQYDDDPPHRFSFDTPAGLSCARYEHRLSNAVLDLDTILNMQAGLTEREARLSTLLKSMPMTQAGSFEIILPPQVRTIRIRQSGMATAESFVSLQYRAAKQFLSGEEAYRTIVHLALAEQSGVDLFCNALRGEFEHNGMDGSAGKETLKAFAQGELYNQWVPSIRLIQSRASSIQRAVKDPGKDEKPVRLLSEDEWTRRRIQARRLEQEEQWVPALESWSDIVNGTEGERRKEALFARIRALGALGESFLATNLLRQLVLFDNDTAVRVKALEQLVVAYEDDQDFESLVMLYSVALMREPTAELLARCVESLVYDQEYDSALRLGTLLPVDYKHHVRASLLKASLAESWWYLFDELLSGIDDAHEQAYWRGLGHLVRNDRSGAMAAFFHAGSQGEAWSQHLEAEVAILKQLEMPDHLDRIDGVKAWLDLQKTGLGLHIWQDWSGTIRESAGAQTLYSIDRDLYGKAFRAEPDQPVVLAIVGPARLKFEVRPLHKTRSAEPIDGWISLCEGDTCSPFSITGNSTTWGLAVAGDRECAVGRSETIYYDVGPGLHDITLVSDVNVVVSVYGQTPMIEGGVLPAPNISTIGLVLDTEEVENRYYDFDRTLPGLCRSCTIVQALSDGNPVWIKHDRYPGVRHTMGVEEQAERLKRNIAPVFEEKDDTTKGSGPKNNAHVVSRLQNIVRMAENSDEAFRRSLAQGEALVHRYPGIGHLQPLIGRMRRAATWKPVTSIVDSAGIRYLPVEGWQPESPALRIRKALLPPVSPDEKVLIGNDELILSVFLVNPVAFEIALTLETVAAVPLTAITVSCCLDGGETIKVVLNPDVQCKTVVLPVPRGRHAIAIKSDYGVGNHVVKVRINEQSEKIGERNRWNEPVERVWSVATGAEPLVAKVYGPAWIRIDQRYDEIVYSRYLLVEEEGREITIVPREEQPEVLVRMFYLAADFEPEQSVVASVSDTPVAVKEPLIHLTIEDGSGTMWRNDEPLCDGQEDGTWSVTTRLVDRRSFQEDEDMDQDRDGEKFCEQNVKYHHFYDPWNAYVLVEGLGRAREHGDPTLGAGASLRWYPRWLPFSAALRAAAYVQRPESFMSGHTEWSAYLNGSVFQVRPLGPKTYHLPKAAIFGRVLSMNRNSRYPAKELDQDIFTPYKGNHKTGIRLSETVYRQPWLDTIWFGGVSATSNEDFNVFNPDHVSSRIGWKQLFQPVQLNSWYRYTYYLDDNDRDDNVTRHIGGLELLWDIFTNHSDRFELGASVEHEFKESETAVIMSLTYFMSNGRGFRDLAPNEIDFETIRKRFTRGISN